MFVIVCNYTAIKPEPSMLKILLIIPSNTYQKVYPLLLFFTQIITYNFHIIQWI